MPSKYGRYGRDGECFLGNGRLDETRYPEDDVLVSGIEVHLDRPAEFHTGQVDGRTHDEVPGIIELRRIGHEEGLGAGGEDRVVGRPNDQLPVDEEFEFGSGDLYREGTLRGKDLVL